MKFCSACGFPKKENEFHRDRSKRDGLASTCKECNARKVREFFTKNPEKAIEYKRRESVKNKDRKRDKRLRREFGISASEYEELLTKQGGVCAVCGNPPNGTRLHVDHSHETGEVRGLLCFGCNAALGLVKDDVSIIQRLLSYLVP